jgi:hypothetical protein
MMAHSNDSLMLFEIALGLVDDFLFIGFSGRIDRTDRASSWAIEPSIAFIEHSEDCYQCGSPVASHVSSLPCVSDTNVLGRSEHLIPFPIIRKGFLLVEEVVGRQDLIVISIVFVFVESRGRST